MTPEEIDPLAEDAAVIREKDEAERTPAEQALVVADDNAASAFQNIVAWVAANQMAAAEAAGKDGRLDDPELENLFGLFSQAERQRSLAWFAYHKELDEGPAPAKPKAPPRHVAPRAKDLSDVLRFGSNNVHGAAVRAFAAARDWQRNPIEGFAYGMAQEFKNIQITVGLPDGTQADSLWAFLAKGGARMVKAHYALWGRWYEDGEGDGSSRDFIIVNVNQFCADLGYTRHHKGGYRREHKQEAVRILEALTAVEMRATWTKPGTKPGTEKAVRLRGPLWSRGLLAEENDQYTDLFGQAREGDPGLWEPLAFSYAPGPWFTNPEWRKYNKAVGKVGAGLLRLPNDKDEWAILIGGYLGTLIRTGKYACRQLRVGTLLERTNLGQGADARRRASEMQRYFERALDRLVEVGVIASWTWADVNAGELADPDDPQALADYYAEEALPAGDWRSRLVEIRWPECFEADLERLQLAQQKAIEVAKRRKQRREQSRESAAE